MRVSEVANRIKTLEKIKIVKRKYVHRHKNKYKDFG